MRRSATLDLRNLPWGGPIPFAGEPGVVQIWEWELAVKVQWIRKYCNFAMVQHWRIYILFSGDFGAGHYCFFDIAVCKNVQNNMVLVGVQFSWGMSCLAPEQHAMTRHFLHTLQWIVMFAGIMRNHSAEASPCSFLSILWMFCFAFLAKDLHPFEHDPLDWYKARIEWLLFPKPEPSAGGVQHGLSNETTPFRFLLPCFKCARSMHGQLWRHLFEPRMYIQW